MESTHAAKRQRIGERTLLACTGCKQRKLKCDGQSPKCQNCIKSSRECLVEDPATGLQRPRDYMQTLESHVAHLESLLQSLRPDIAGDHLNAQFVPPGADSAATWLFSGHHPLAAPALSQAANLIDAPEAYTSPAGQSGADSFVDDLSSDVALLCISAAGREPHYFGPSSAVSFSRIASQAMGIRTSQGRAVSESPSEQRAGRDRSGRTTKAVMPTDAQADTYVSAYFNNIHPQYPFLHEPTFQRWQGECRQTGDLDDELSRAGNIPTFFVFMVYAIGCLTLGPSQYGAAEDFYAVALDRITPILDLDSLESIQSILCCAVYSIRSPVGASLWKVSGMAIRHCVELGYHRSAKRFRQQTDMLAREMSTRCFWVAYDIDRVAANILGRPDGISDHLIDAEYPLDIDDEFITAQTLLQEPRISSAMPPTSMSGAIHVIKLRRLWSKFGVHLYQPDRNQPQGQTQSSTVHRLRQELDDWLACAPDANHTSPSHPRSTFASHKWFRLAYCHSILLLYRPFIMEAHMPSAQSFNQINESQLSDVAFRECCDSAKEICVLYRKLFQSTTIQLTWGGLHILFMAALTYLYCLWRSDCVRGSARTSDVVSTCMACTTVLVTIAERWPSASTYRNIFETLSERTINMICDDKSHHPVHGSVDTSRLAPLEQHSSHPQAYSDMPGWFHEAPNIGLPGSQSLLQELMEGIGEPSGFIHGDTTIHSEQDFNFGAEWPAFDG